MYKSILIGKVKVCRTKSGEIEFHLPSDMGGIAFVEWKAENAVEIQKAKDELMAEGVM